jgi:hypothetical protein
MGSSKKVVSVKPILTQPSKDMKMKKFYLPKGGDIDSIHKKQQLKGK